MKILAYIRSRLVWKLFLSYLVVLAVGGVVQISAAELVAPSAFQSHLAEMAHLMGGQSGQPVSAIEANLYRDFRLAFSDALALAALAAFAAGLLASLFVSRQVGAPVNAMMRASQRIADGEYRERVRVPSIPIDQLDELNQLALSFNQMAARLERTEEMRTRLLGDVAHELRTPLTGIKGSMEGLIDGVLPATPEAFQGVYREADRMQRLVNDLLELSRVEAGAFELHPHPVPVSGLVQGVVTRLERQYEEKGVVLETELPGDLPPALADEDRIGQVLLNLTGNALQYTPAGGRVRLAARCVGKEIQVAVCDNGAGIPAEHLPHVFERFYRVDKSRSRAGGGNGIGLTIAKFIVEAHGGRIWAKSEGAGKGSTFTFSLPAAAAEDQAQG